MTEAASQPVVLTIDGAVATLNLNRPRQGNSLSMELVACLQGHLEDLSPNPAIKVIVITGSGGRIFSAGHDLNEFVGEPEPDFLERDFAGIARLMQQVMAQPQIVIAKVEGVATAAGCELVAACDLALASSVARFGVPGVNIGFWCHTPQVPLSRQIGRKQAMLMLATGQLYPAEHALRIGLINSLHDHDKLDEAVEELARTIVAIPSSVLRLGKASFVRQSSMPITEAYEFAKREALSNITLPDAKEGIEAFLQKRAPDWPTET